MDRVGHRVERGAVLALGVAEGLFGPLALGDVAPGALDEVSPPNGDRPGADVDVADLSALCPLLRLEAIGSLADDLLEVLGDLYAGLDDLEVGDRELLELLAGVAEALVCLVVELYQCSGLCVDEHDGVRRLLEDRAVSLFGLAQGLFRPLAFGDIAHRADHAGRAPALVAKQRVVHEGGKDGAVAACVPHLAAELAGLPDLPGRRLDGGHLLGGVEDRQRLADQLLWAIPMHRREGLVDEKQPPLEVGHGDAIGALCHGPREEPQTLLGLSLLGDVLDRALVVERLPCRVAHGPGALADEQRAAVALRPGRLQPDHLPVALDALLEVRAGVPWLVPLCLELAVGELLEGRVAQHAHQGRVGHQDAAVGRGAVQAEHGVLENASETLLALAQCLLGPLAAGDVAADGLESHHAPVLVADDVIRPLLPADAAVGHHDAVLVRGHGVFRG